jgi:hypothetical protein
MSSSTLLPCQAAPVERTNIGAPASTLRTRGLTPSIWEIFANPATWATGAIPNAGAVATGVATGGPYTTPGGAGIGGSLIGGLGTGAGLPGLGAGAGLGGNLLGNIGLTSEGLVIEGGFGGNMTAGAIAGPFGADAGGLGGGGGRIVIGPGGVSGGGSLGGMLGAGSQAGQQRTGVGIGNMIGGQFGGMPAPATPWHCAVSPFSPGCI